MGGMKDKAKGVVKEAAGKVTSDPDLEAEGKIDQAKGHVKEAGHALKERVERRRAETKEEVAERARKAAEELERKTKQE
jgi:uncharacterized protein YjbJ (UPF0337 family)